MLLCSLPVWNLSIRKTSLDLDKELLDEVRAILGTRNLEEMVEEALREVVRDRARREEVNALSEMDGMDLIDPEIMSRAWER